MQIDQELLFNVGFGSVHTQMSMTPFTLLQIDRTNTTITSGLLLTGPNVTSVNIHLGCVWKVDFQNRVGTSILMAARKPSKPFGF